ncbi:unnamed protein product [Amoebophrya sp. A120]|nr:unnamed protein product [Amoebophrya sp. A120]|eukprot:GSA120T00017475001.1
MNIFREVFDIRVGEFSATTELGRELRDLRKEVRKDLEFPTRCKCGDLQKCAFHRQGPDDRFRVADSEEFWGYANWAREEFDHYPLNIVGGATGDFELSEHDALCPVAQDWSHGWHCAPAPESNSARQQIVDNVKERVHGVGTNDKKFLGKVSRHIGIAALTDCIGTQQPVPLTVRHPTCGRVGTPGHTEEEDHYLQGLHHELFDILDEVRAFPFFGCSPSSFDPAQYRAYFLQDSVPPVRFRLQWITCGCDSCKKANNGQRGWFSNLRLAFVHMRELKEREAIREFAEQVTKAEQVQGPGAVPDPLVRRKPPTADPLVKANAKKCLLDGLRAIRLPTHISLTKDDKLLVKVPLGKDTAGKIVYKTRSICPERFGEVQAAVDAAAQEKEETLLNKNEHVRKINALRREREHAAAAAAA